MGALEILGRDVGGMDRVYDLVELRSRSIGRKVAPLKFVYVFVLLYGLTVAGLCVTEITSNGKSLQEIKDSFQRTLPKALFLDITLVVASLIWFALGLQKG